MYIAARWEREALFDDGKKELGLDWYQLVSASVVLLFWTSRSARFRLFQEMRMGGMNTRLLARLICAFSCSRVKFVSPSRKRSLSQRS